MASSDFLRQEYTSRINRVIDYVEGNVDGDLSLATLADVAGFSRFHFHRLFHALVGETLNDFIGRVRVEKAAGQLIGHPKHSITQVAHACGFADAATFARAFREAYGMSASEWRAGGFKAYVRRTQESKERKALGKDGQEGADASGYAELVSGGRDPRTSEESQRRVPMFDEKSAPVRVEDVPEFHVAYVRHIGPYKGNSGLFGDLFGRLMRWAGPRGLIGGPNMKMLTIYHDHPELTEEDRQRVSVCLAVPPETPVDGEIGKMAVPGGKYALTRFEIDADQYQQAWDYVVGSWLPGSGYQPDDRPCYEMYLNDPQQHPQKKHIFDLVMPVKPL